MPSVTFTITSEEVRELASKKLSRPQIKKILEHIENDNVLWDNIEAAIKAAIEQVTVAE